MNKVILIGRLTRDLENSTTSGGLSVSKFTVAVQRKFKNSDGEYEADFINIVAWRTLADNCAKYLNKGSKVAVCGSIQTRSYDDKNGDKRYVTEVVAEDVQFLSTDTKQGAQSPLEPLKGNTKKKTEELEKIEDENLPF